MSAAKLLSFIRANNYQLDSETKNKINEIKSEFALELYQSHIVEDRPLIHYLLYQQIEELKKSWGVPCALKACTIILFKLRQAEDSIFIWEAKTCNSDTLFSIDVQLLLGAGVKETIAFLEKSTEVTHLTKVIKEERDRTKKEYSILDWIESCRKNGELEDIDSHVENLIDHFESDCEDFFQLS